MSGLIRLSLSVCVVSMSMFAAGCGGGVGGGAASLPPEGPRSSLAGVPLDLTALRGNGGVSGEIHHTPGSGQPTFGPGFPGQGHGLGRPAPSPSPEPSPVATPDPSPTVAPEPSPVATTPAPSPTPTTPPGPPLPAFLAAQVFPAGLYPSGWAQGDLDGDGRMDLLVTNNGSHDLSVLLGDGRGGFAPPVSFPTGQYPRGVAVADFDGDGDLDAAVANQGPYEYRDRWDYSPPSPDTVSVLLGNGDGTFAPAVETLACPNPGGIVAGDFTGDGLADVVVSSPETSELHVLPGTGGASLGAATVVPMPSGAGSLAVADADGDGRTDLLVGVYNGFQCLLANGDGTFAAPVTSGTSWSNALAVGDANGDGRVDVLTAGGSGNTAEVWHGAGDGSFALGASVATNWGPAGVALVEANGDGRPDLVVTHGTSANAAVYLNGGSSFTRSTSFYIGSSAYSVVGPDLDGDGSGEVVVLSSEAGGAMVARSRGDGTYHVAPRTATAGSATHFATADFNGDGRSDVAVPNRYGGGVNVLLARADGSLGSAVHYSAGAIQGPFDVATGDLNGDGITDLVMGSVGHGQTYGGVNGVGVLLGNGSGGFSSLGMTNTDLVVLGLAVADFTGDGRADVAVCAQNTSSIVLLAGNGSGGFASRTTAVGGLWGNDSVSAGDFDGDGDPDLAVPVQGDTSTGQPGVVFAFNDGSGNFPTRVSAVTGNLPIRGEAADVDSDGHLDYVVGCASWPAPGAWLVRGNGDGTFQPATLVGDGASPASDVGLADVNGDGILDVITSSGAVAVHAGRGDGTFLPAVRFAGGSGYNAAGDLDGDGRTDLVVTSAFEDYGGAVATLLRR